MESKWVYLLTRLSKRMWFRAALYCALGILAALIGAVIKPIVPSYLAGLIGASSVGNLLGILASSMLAVTTFSLSTMVSAYSAASSSATPRAAKLLIEDNGAQGALATFIGAFLFSIVGLIALSTGIYGDSGRVVLFIATVIVIALITITLLRWVEQLSRFGRVGETIDLVEAATRSAMQRYAEDPCLGGVADTEEGEAGWALFPDDAGYVQYIDMGRLAELADTMDRDIRVAVLPGAFVSRHHPLLRVAGTPDDAMVDRLRDAISLGDARTFEHDPRYGLIVLTEIAVRALSPGINDPGTAIDIIGTVVRLLENWGYARQKAETGAEPREVRYPRIKVPVLNEADMFDDVFPAIARDGAGMAEIGIRLQKALATLACIEYAPCRETARDHARWALARAMRGLEDAADRQRVLDAAMPAIAREFEASTPQDLRSAGTRRSGPTAHPPSSEA